MRVFQRLGLNQRLLTRTLSALWLLELCYGLATGTTDVTDPGCTTSTTQRTVWYGDKEITYYTQGPSDGPILVFLHGWPAVAETWRLQIDHFSELGYYVVAPDMPGYGRSTANNVASDYAHESIITGLLAMLADTGRKSAVWIGHDWGAAVGSSLAAVHPEVVDAMAWLSVPYKNVELGYEYVLQFANRTVYPEPDFHYAQWDYQRFYNTNFDRATSVFETNYEYAIRALYTRSGGNASVIGTQSPLSHITANNGWFCGVDSLPPPANTRCPPGQTLPPPTIPLNATVLNQDVYDALVTAMKNTTFTPGDAYYLNQQANKDYIIDNQKNDGKLDVPCLFIQADYDTVLDTIDSTLLDPMLAQCKDFSFAHFPTGHWVQLEAANGTNMAIAEWLATNVTSYVPAAMFWNRAA